MTTLYFRTFRSGSSTLSDLLQMTILVLVADLVEENLQGVVLQGVVLLEEGILQGVAHPEGENPQEGVHQDMIQDKRRVGDHWDNLPLEDHL